MFGMSTAAEMNDGCVSEEANFEEVVTTEKPVLSKGWSWLLTFSFLSCLGVLFISAVELKIILISVSASLILVSLYKIIGYDGEVNRWYAENPHLIPEKKSRRGKSKGKKNIKARTISIKK